MSARQKADAPRRLGILAGRGALPRQVARYCARSGQPVFVIDLEGHASGWAGAFESARFSLGQVGGALRALRVAGCDAVTLAGGIERPDFRALRFDLKGTMVLPRVLRHARGGDDALLRGVMAMFEEEGFRVLPAQDFLPEGVAGHGPIIGADPGREAMEDIALGRAILAALSPFDIGQAVVTAGGRCLAVEAAEGTAAMLARVQELGATGGVLVKAPKAAQSRRADLPAIGPDTVDDAAAAGLVGIAVEADGVLLLERETTCAIARRSGLFLYGFDAGS